MKTSKEKDNMNDKYWKSIDELVEQPEFKNFVHNEFSEGTIELPNNISRKNFLYLMGASIAMAGFSGCRKPVRKILPYISAPEEIIPGIPNYYASSFSLGLNAFGVVVETHEGRPTHIEGNEKHSSSLGAVNQYIQSSILDLYDPDRAKNISNNDDDSDINDFIEYCHSYNYNDGKGMYVVSKTITSPTTYRLYKEFLKKFPKAMWIAYDTVNQENLINGIRVATDKNLIPRYKFDKAKTILSLESDFLSDHYDNINNCKTFSKSRKVGEEMNRLYVAESFVSSTGMMADHRFKIQSNDVVMLLSLLNNALLSKGVSGLERINNNSFKVNSKLKKFVEVVSDELILNKGKSIIMAGDNQPVEIHSLVYAINHSLSNNSKTIDYYNLDDVLLSNTDDMQDLMNQINLGNVKTLINLDVDLLYHFKNQINESKYKDIPNKISCSYHSDLTSKFSTWHVPLAHYMESWLDCKSIDGTLSVGQPMISPLYKDCLGINQILSIFLGNKNTNDQDLIKKTWKKILGSQFSSSWNRVLHDGLLEGKYNSKYSENKRGIKYQDAEYKEID